MRKYTDAEVRVAFGQCEVCGETATHLIQDWDETHEHPYWKTYKAHGPIHHYCNVHKRDPVIS